MSSNAKQEPPVQVSFTVIPERLPLIPLDQMTEAQKKVRADLEAGPRGELKGSFVSMMRSPEFAARVEKVGEYIRFYCPLDKRINEFAAIIAARHWNQQFEWWAHHKHALAAGLDPAIAEAVREGRRPTGMAEDEEVVYDLLTEVLVNKGTSDTTYARAVKVFGEAGTIDVLGVAGYYALLAMVLNVARTAVTEGHPLPLPPLPVRMQPA